MVRRIKQYSARFALGKAKVIKIDNLYKFSKTHNRNTRETGKTLVFFCTSAIQILIFLFLHHNAYEYIYIFFILRISKPRTTARAYKLHSKESLSLSLSLALSYAISSDKHCHCCIFVRIPLEMLPQKKYKRSNKQLNCHYRSTFSIIIIILIPLRYYLIVEEWETRVDRYILLNAEQTNEEHDPGPLGTCSLQLYLKQSGILRNPHPLNVKFRCPAPLGMYTTYTYTRRKKSLCISIYVLYLFILRMKTK